MSAVSRVPGILGTMWKANHRQPVLPRFLTYIVTFTCNARCIMCDSWKMKGKDDLALDEIERIFDQLPRMDGVRLTGGEPFGRKDLLDIAHLVQRKLQPMFLHVTTNGFLTDRIIDFCERRDKSTPISILISIDGKSEKHNHVRGRENAWDTATKTLREIARRKKEFNATVGINQTIVDVEGVAHYKLLREEFRGLGIHHHMVMAYDVSATYSLERDKEFVPSQIGRFTTFGDFSVEHLDELFAEVEKDIEQLPLVERTGKRYYLRGIRNRLLHGVASPNPKCVALSAHMRLFPNGDVPTCQFSSKVVGNLRQQSFAEVWNSEKIAAQRQWVNNCPGCWAECEVLPNALYTGDLVRQSLFHGQAGAPKAPQLPAPEGVAD